MPRAIATRTQKKVDLRTCPPDGFVLLQRWDFGEMLDVSDASMAVGMDDLADDAEPTNGDKSKRKVKAEQIRMTTSTRFATPSLFAKCIADHNLEDEGGRKLDFRRASDVRKLDTSIGKEIEDAINTFLSEEESEDVGKSNSKPSTSSSKVHAETTVEK